VEILTARMVNWNWYFPIRCSHLNILPRWKFFCLGWWNFVWNIKTHIYPTKKTHKQEEDITILLSLSFICADCNIYRYTAIQWKNPRALAYPRRSQYMFKDRPSYCRCLYIRGVWLTITICPSVVSFPHIKTFILDLSSFCYE
jgi:hypothetical protein